MDKSKIKFGDKIFLYGQFMNPEHWQEYGYYNPNYNSVMGYMPTGGYGIIPRKTEIMGACVPGYIVDYLSTPSLAVKMPFANEELLDVTDNLSLELPLTKGCRVWMPVCDITANPIQQPVMDSVQY
jgi:hypothetical protein